MGIGVVVRLGLRVTGSVMNSSVRSSEVVVVVMVVVEVVVVVVVGASVPLVMK